MEPNIGGDDARKKRQSKRENAEVVLEHKGNKLRKFSETNVKTATVTSPTAAAATDVPASVVVTKAAAANEQTNASAKANPASDPNKEHSTNETMATTTREAVKHPAAVVKTTTTVGKQDLESALHYVATIGEGRSEPLSDDTALSFRVGHAGDASTLATWYRNSIGGNLVNNIDASSSTLGSSTTTTDSPATATGSTDEHTKENSPSKISAQQPATNHDETPGSDPTPATTTTTTCLDQSGSSSLDLWLVDGLGDEDIPPSLFALIADVTTTKTDSTNNATKSSPKMAAVALLTSSWENSSRVLRLEWFQIDDSSLDHQSQSKLVERRMWLRLSLLSLVTSSELRVVDPSTNFNALTAATTTTTTKTTTQTQVSL